jgi:hypothetical protein
MFEYVLRMNTNEITEVELAAALTKLAREHRNNWLEFNAKIGAILKAMELRMGCRWTSDEDITEDVSDEDFAAAGFTPAEANALTFVLTSDCMGQAVDSAEMIERWFCYCAAR